MLIPTDCCQAFLEYAWKIARCSGRVSGVVYWGTILSSHSHYIAHSCAILSRGSVWLNCKGGLCWKCLKLIHKVSPCHHPPMWPVLWSLWPSKWQPYAWTLNQFSLTNPKPLVQTSCKIRNQKIVQLTSLSIYICKCKAALMWWHCPPSWHMPYKQYISKVTTLML